jgi:hypothetical protein|nr:MAG TPA: hypothetical protein [Caudoviricetes sp.]
MVKKLNLYLKNNSSGFFHNSREDVKNLSKVINIIIEKINDCILALNNLEKELKDLKKEKENG